MAACFVLKARFQLKFLKAVSRYVICSRRQTHSGQDERFEKLSKKEYWVQEYQNPTETFDWFLSEDVVSSFVCHALLNVASKKDFSEVPCSMHHRKQPVNILDLGCGRSVLPLCFYEWTPFPVAIHCLDFVQEVVDFQLKILQSNPSGHLDSYACGICASVCSLPYQSNLFHLVTDKGTMDALLKDPVNGANQARIMLNEVERVLQKGASFMQVTDEDPDSRMYFLETHSPPSCSWRFSILVDGGKNNKECFVYSFSK